MTTFPTSLRAAVEADVAPSGEANADLEQEPTKKQGDASPDTSPTPANEPTAEPLAPPSDEPVTAKDLPAREENGKLPTLIMWGLGASGLVATVLVITLMASRLG